MCDPYMGSGTEAESPQKFGKDKVQRHKSYVTKRHGAWNFNLMDEDYREKLGRIFDDTTSSLPALYRMAHDIYSLSPRYFLLFCASQIWSSCQSAINLHFSSSLLRVVELILSGEISGPEVVYRSILTRVFCLAFTEYISWHSQLFLSRMQRRIKSHFELQIIKGKLGHNLKQSRSAAHRIGISSEEAWEAFLNVIKFAGWIIDALSQLILITHLCRQSGGPLFALFCVIKPLILTATQQSLWDRVCVLVQDSKSQVRMDALTTLVEPSYRQDVISGDLRDYIVSEYQKASKEMEDTPDDTPEDLFERSQSPWVDMIIRTLGDLPILYCSILAATNPKHVSITSIAILQKSASSISWLIEIVSSGMERYRQSLKLIRELYEIEGRPDRKMVISKKQKEQTGTLDATATLGGMGIELRGLSFAYPDSQTKTRALDGIDLTIQPGQFIVIVGSNGSGKSTLIKLLAHLYQHPQDDEDSEGGEETGPNNEDFDSVTGTILIDSLPASSYTESSLRQSIVVLNQDNRIYPGFSLGENIGMGYTPLLGNEEVMMDAAKKAGAAKVLQRMKDGANTVLNPLLTYYDYNVRCQGDGHPLKKLLNELRDSVEVSGGERQRLVAARTFMRLKSGNIRLVLVDEPSSALDAEAEVNLSKNLLKEREGKTVIFVTHRFGQLTRQADLIVCMKEGAIAESGTHEKLMSVDGEYKKLYDIQASAFLDVTEGDGSDGKSDDE